MDGFVPDQTCFRKAVQGTIKPTTGNAERNLASNTAPDTSPEDTIIATPAAQVQTDLDAR